MSLNKLGFNDIVRNKPVGTRFILVRHGETDWNKEKRFQGHIDIPLNAHGVQQAQRVRQCLEAMELRGTAPYEHCVSSDLDRAHNTANIIHGNKTPPPLLNKALRERDYGHLAGLTGDEMLEKSPEEFANLRSRIPDAPLLDGESLAQFYQRVVVAFEQIADELQGHTTLLVAHGGVLDCIYRHCTGEALEKQRDWQLPNCALNVVEIDSQGNKSVKLWAWTGHLHHDKPTQNMDEVDGRVA